MKRKKQQSKPSAFLKFKFNIPNKITIIRLILIPLFVAILLAKIPYKNLFAAFIFIMLSISDFLDGYFARKKNQVTELGKLIDPIADKFLISTALVFLIGKGVDLWMAVAIISREVIITAIRVYLLPLKLVVPASSLGKAKTVVQSIAIVLVLLSIPYSWHIMLVAVLLTLVSGTEYLFRIHKLTGNKVVNLPNLVTLSRFLLIIPFVYYFWNEITHISLPLFAIITLSDKLDGISARLMNQKTELGSGFDSFTDWTLIISTFVLFMIKNKISMLWVVLLVTPAIISAVMKMIYAKRKRIVPVTLIAQINAGLTYVTIASVLINFRYVLYLLTAAIAVGWLSMIVYVVKALSTSNRYAQKISSLKKSSDSQ